MTIKKIIPVVVFALSILLLGSIFFTPNAKADENNYEIKTITEIGNPTIAGTSAYLDDGVLYYGSGGNTVGYNIDHSNTLFEFDIILTSFSFPNWISFTFRASGLDRTQSSNLEQKGYSFALFPAGNIKIWKDGATLINQNKSFEIDTKYNFKIGAINEGENVRLILKVNDESVIDLIDNDNPYLTGNWFNICGEGAVSAEIHTTKKVIIPNYYTYTLSTLGQYPVRAGNPLPEVDKYNNIKIKSSGSSLGFGQSLQNFSLEMKFNFSTFAWPANFYFMTRASGFDRINTTSLERKGYAFRLSTLGDVQIYKEGASLISAKAGFSIQTDTDYIIEIGTVDINENSTYIFMAINNKVVVSAFDNDTPIQAPGFINMHGDGKIVCEITSSNTKLTPLKTSIIETDDSYEISTYFLNPLSYQSMQYENFGERNLKSISINDQTIYGLNNNFYALEKGAQTNAVDLKFEENILKIIIKKAIYSKSTNANAILKPEKLSIQRTSGEKGLASESGFVLKQTYIQSF